MWMQVLYPRCTTTAPVSKQPILAALNWTHSHVGQHLAEAWIRCTGWTRPVTRPSRKTLFSRKTVRLSRKISLSQKKSEGVSYDIAGKLYISQKRADLLIFLPHSQKHVPLWSKWKSTITYWRPFRDKMENVGFCCYFLFFCQKFKKQHQ